MWLMATMLDNIALGVVVHIVIKKNNIALLPQWRFLTLHNKKTRKKKEKKKNSYPFYLTAILQYI